MALQKQFSVRIFDSDGTFRKTYALKPAKNLPSFSSRINGTLGELVVDLGVPFDDFSEGINIDFMNIVDLVVIDEANPRGRRIYRGVTSRYEPYIQGGEEGVRVTALGLGSLLTRSFYKNGSSFTVTHTTVDPTAVFQAIIDHFNTVYGGSLISYDASSIPATVGTNISITYTDQKWFDAATKAVQLAGTGFWWSIDADGKANLKAKSSTPTHTFKIGGNLDSLSCTKDSEKVVNDLFVRRVGGTETSYSDATSQSDFGTGSPSTGKVSKIISDASLTDLNAADQRGNKEIAENKDEKIRASITVNKNYDLESIKVGDTCQILGFRKANTFFGSNNLQIVGLTYAGDSVKLELGEQSADFGLELEQFIA